jgi:hypothetical protein
MRPSVELSCLKHAVSARIGDLTDVMVEEYGGVRQFAGPIVQSGADVFLVSAPGVRLRRFVPDLYGAFPVKGL